MLIREDKTKERVAQPVNLTAVFPVPSESLHRVYRGVRMSDLPSLWPDSTVRDLALSAAKTWVSHMRLQDFDLLDNESDLRVWGPYRPKAKSLKGVASGWSNQENMFPDGEAEMLITGRFLARKQHVVEVN